MLRLGLNIDHIATVRNARGGVHPDPVHGALMAIEAGVDGITAHLREDRRHIRDDDIRRLKARIDKPLNFEMAVTDEMIAMAIEIKPHAACLVPERREEVTTEGGLDVIGQKSRVADATAVLSAEGMRVSLFIDPVLEHVEMARHLEAPVIELHTGAYCEAVMAGDRERAASELSRLQVAAAHAHDIGLEVHAGHGLDFLSVKQVAAIPQVVELNIGHFMIGEAIFMGIERVVTRMRAIMDEARR